LIAVTNLAGFRVPGDANHDSVYDLVVSAIDGSRQQRPNVHVRRDRPPESWATIHGGNGNDALTEPAATTRLTRQRQRQRHPGGNDNISAAMAMYLDRQPRQLPDGGNGDDTPTPKQRRNQLIGGNETTSCAGNGRNSFTAATATTSLPQAMATTSSLEFVTRYHARQWQNTFVGGTGNDRVTVGNGKQQPHRRTVDVLHVGTGNNTLIGGNGNDLRVRPRFRQGYHHRFSSMAPCGVDDGVFANFQTMHQVGVDYGDQLLTEHTITLQHVAASGERLHASDFLFG
jgi:Ca2+-binding RTX toxin-like protein